LLYRPFDEAVLVSGWNTHPEMKQDVAMARANWEKLKTIQWIDHPKLGDLDRTISALLATADTDPERVKLHTLLLLRVRDWEGRGYSPSVLLRGDDLSTYERWRDLSAKKGNQPQPTKQQIVYVLESRRADNARRRNQILAIGISAFSLISAAIL